MKAAKIILAIFGVLGVAVIFLILLCHFRPGTSDAISKLLYRDKSKVSQTDQASDATKDGDIQGNQKDSNSRQTDSEEGLSINKSEIAYEAPDESMMKPSETLMALTGYEPVEDTGTEIKKKEAEELKDTLGYGNTGDDLTFDETMYPYYHMLNDTLQKLYRQIYANAKDLTAEFVPVELVASPLLKNAFTAVVNDHPELFWVDTSYEYKYTGKGTAEMDLHFNETAEDLESLKALFDNRAEEVLSGARGLSSDYEKETYVHDKLLENLTYQLKAPLNQSAYSGIVSGKTVCAGYARSFQYLMQQLSVPCYYCTGYSGENHAWNIIKLDDVYYNVDVTWDDAEPNTHDYFNCSDADYAKDHARRDLSVYLPPCNGNQNGGEENVQAKRTLEEAGFTEEQILTDLAQYYSDCYDQLMSKDESEIVFQNVVASDTILQEIYGAYENETYKTGFMNRVMEDKSIDSCGWNVADEELEGGYILVTHIFTL